MNQTRFLLRCGRTFCHCWDEEIKTDGSTESVDSQWKPNGINA